MMAVFSLQLHAYWLAFTVVGGPMRGTRVEKEAPVLPSWEPCELQQDMQDMLNGAKVEGVSWE